MELPFLRDWLADRHGLDVLVPDAPERELLHRAVFEELALGIFTDATRAAFVRIIGRLGEEGATAVILGCTEFGLLLRPGDVELPLYDTGRLHAEAAVTASLA
jgi:aspartate racemase